MIKLNTPISEKDIRKLKCGDSVSLSGTIVTARDAGHKLMVEEKPEFLEKLLMEGVIYHCGPVVKNENGKWNFVSAGPTTSIREEPYEDKVITHYRVRCIIGKGGMGDRTLKACNTSGAVYLHAIGGCGTSIAEAVKEVTAVYRLEEFGSPEAFWVCRVEDFPLVVTMDSHGNSLHEQIEKRSRENFNELIT